MTLKVSGWEDAVLLKPLAFPLHTMPWLLSLAGKTLHRASPPHHYHRCCHATWPLHLWRPGKITGFMSVSAFSLLRHSTA